jgi:hypothetical protein
MATRNTGLIIELPDGARYGVKSLAVKNRLYPDATVISHADGTPFEAATAAPKQPRKKAAPKRTRKPKPLPAPVADQAEEVTGNVAE